MTYFWNSDRTPFVSFELCYIVADPGGGGGIDIYSGLRKNVQGGGVQFEILQNPGIDLYSGFRKTSQGGWVQVEILKMPPPLISKPGSATAINLSMILYVTRVHNY